MSPDLLLLSGRIALLVLLASLLAFVVGWLINGWRAAAALKRLQTQLDQKPEITVSQPSDDALQAKALAEELRRNLSATESQCVIALEQRDEAERQAVQKASEAHKLAEELAELKGKVAAAELVDKTVHQSDEFLHERADQASRSGTPFPDATFEALNDRPGVRSDVGRSSQNSSPADSRRTEVDVLLDARERALAAANEIAQELEAEAAAAKSALETQQSEHAATKAALEAQLAEQTEARAALESQVAKLAETQQSAETQRSEHAASKAALEAKLAEQTEARAALESQIAKLTEAQQSEYAAAKAALEAKLAEQTEARAALESQVSKLAETQQSAEAQQSEHAAAKAALEAKLAEQTEARAALESQIAKLTEAQQSEHAATKAALEAKLAEQTEARAALESQVATLAETQQSAESQQSEYAAANAALEAKLAEQTEARAALESQVAKLAETQQSAESQQSEYAATKAALEGKLAEQTEARAALESQVAKLADTQQALEALQGASAETKASLETLLGQLQSLQNAYAGTVTEIGHLKHQLASAEALATVRQGQVDQLTQEKVVAEIALRARIAELEAHASRPVVHVGAPVPVRLPKPPLPPVEVLAAPADDSFFEFPRAPEETGRRPLGESLFDESAMASFNPEVPSMDDARATLASLEQELQEKEQVIGLLTAEQAQLWDDLEAVRRSSPEEQHHKLHPAERAEHAATAKLATTASERDRCRRQVRALTRSLALAAEADRADDLTRIKGIKSGISQQLHAFGICTYRQIVEWDEEDMAAFSELLAFKNRMYRDKWQTQAKALMEAKYGKKTVA